MNVRLTAKKVEIGCVDEIHVLKVNGMSLDLESSLWERMARYILASFVCG